MREAERNAEVCRLILTAIGRRRKQTEARKKKPKSTEAIGLLDHAMRAKAHTNVVPLYSCGSKQTGRRGSVNHARIRAVVGDHKGIVRIP